MAGLVYTSSGLDVAGGDVGMTEPGGSAVRLSQVQDGYGFGICGGDEVFE